ncbi:hypothetical protein SAMN05660209_03929 [Geodermatophilus africanus]|uniref:Uncharacterized protein n=1 Tax=Geodermatophilus africanus TaxID=1137993 RepID=A0A1H3NFF0_9ACTN|nr:hypothetical protein [Geodermatophilus africanus]SDY87588.1 hypothetical protein SAMN05660209_03929 [Geodermatophilus africanus]
MTHSIDSPFPPPPSTGSGATSGASTVSTTTTSQTTSGSPSTTDVAKDEARNVGQTAAQAGSQVASTAADQAKEVVGEAKNQAQDLVQQGRQQLRQQTVAQQQKAAGGLTSLAQELRGLADGSSQGAPGPARDLLQQASSYVEQFADRLQNREPADLLDDVRAFARRRPGTFLLGAALAGVLAGRLTSGVKAAHSDGPSSTGGQHRSTYTQTNYVDPAPAYSGYTETTSYETTTGYTGAPATGTPVPPPPYGTVPPAGAAVPPTTPAGWDDPARRPGQGV